MTKRHCCHCIWFDKCGQDAICDSFSPVNDDLIAGFTYEQDLRERVKLYDELLSELETDPAVASEDADETAEQDGAAY